MVPTPAPRAHKRAAERPSQTAWTQAFRVSHAQRARMHSLPFIWMLIVCTVLPVGLRSNFEIAGRADQVQAIPDPTLEASRAAAPASEVLSPAVSSNAAPSDAAPSDEVLPGEVLSNEVLSKEVLSNETPANPIERLPATPGRTIFVRAIVSGKTVSGRVTIPLKGASVGEALLELGVSLGKLDRVTPLAQTAAYDGMTVRVSRVRAALQKRFVAIAPQTRFKPTHTLRAGSRKTVQTGKPGKIEITERVWSKDGKVTLREYVGRRVVARPQDTIVALGTRSYYMPNKIPYHNRYARAYTLSARGGSPRDRLMPPDPGTFRALKSITMIATGYSPDPRENGGYTTTATGLPIGYGAAAVDPRVIPLGTKLYVEGYGYAFACDTGGAIKGKRIDLAYDSYYLANTKGRKKVKVWILGK